jgi:hypothetical protein
MTNGRMTFAKVTEGDLNNHYLRIPPTGDDTSVWLDESRTLASYRIGQHVSVYRLFVTVPSQYWNLRRNQVLGG